MTIQHSAIAAKLHVFQLAGTPENMQQINSSDTVPKAIFENILNCFTLNQDTSLISFNKLTADMNWIIINLFEPLYDLYLNDTEYIKTLIDLDSFNTQIKAQLKIIEETITHQHNTLLELQKNTVPDSILDVASDPALIRQRPSDRRVHTHIRSIRRLPSNDQDRIRQCAQVVRNTQTLREQGLNDLNMQWDTFKNELSECMHKALAESITLQNEAIRQIRNIHQIGHLNPVNPSFNECLKALRVHQLNIHKERINQHKQYSLWYIILCALCILGFLTTTATNILYWIESSIMVSYATLNIIMTTSLSISFTSALLLYWYQYSSIQTYQTQLESITLQPEGRQQIPHNLVLGPSNSEKFSQTPL